MHAPHERLTQMEPQAHLARIRADDTASWQRHLVSTFGGLRLASMAEGTSGTIELARVGPGMLSTISSSTQRVQRVPAADGLDATIKLLVQLRGTCALNTEAGQLNLEPRGLALVDGHYAFELAFEGPFEQVLLQMPREVIRPLGGRASSRRPVAGAVGSPVDSLLADLVELIVARRHVLGGSAERSAAFESVLRLLPVTSLLSPPAPASPQTVRLRRFERATSDIERFACEADTTPARIAGLQGVSRRYLDGLFAEFGASVAQAIRERRLVEAGHLLRSQPGRSVLDIALSVGFSDAASFTRAFRRRYLETPTTWRNKSARTCSGSVA